MTNALTRLLALLGISSPQALRAFLVGIASMYVAQKLFAAQPASRRRLAPVAADAVPAARAATGGAAKGGKAGAGGDDDEIEVDGSLDLRRQAAIAFGRASDHSGELLVVNSPTFDMNKTIFRNIEGFFPRAVMKARIGVDLYWTDHAAERIQLAASVVPKAPSHDRALIEFMNDDCDFAMEHADGSFMDHLKFCYEYSAVHFKAHSPRVLFLHSIMGVGTNYFPMTVDKVPKLQAMLTAFEMRHIEAFPSMLRLLNCHEFLAELAAQDNAKLETLESLSYHRVIDNAPLTMAAEDLWIHLNYQLIHLLDFIPASNWLAQTDDLFFQQFVPLHRFLTRTNRLWAQLDFDITEGDATTAGLPVSLGSVIGRVVPSNFKRQLGRKAMQKYSAAVGHSLEYKINWGVGAGSASSL